MRRGPGGRFVVVLVVVLVVVFVAVHSGVTIVGGRKTELRKTECLRIKRWNGGQEKKGCPT